MSRPFSEPSYLKHSKLYARTKLWGKYIALGRYNSPESLKRYQEVLSQFRTGKPPATVTINRSGLTIVELAATWFEHTEAKGMYQCADGTSSELRSWRLSLGPLIRLFGSELARDFSPKRLKLVRTAMCTGAWMTDEEKATRADKPCEIRWCRRTVNQRVKRIVRLFKFGVSEELVPVDVYQALYTVMPLPTGSRDAHDNPERGPVPMQDVRDTLPLMPSIVRAMALLQLATGMRPSEICGMRVADIARCTRTRGVWVYQLGTRHKTGGKGICRQIPLGPAAQLVLADRLTGEWVFPAATGGHYRVCSYIDRVREAAKKAGVPPWSPGLLRKVVATDLEERFGIETARAQLGHTKPNTTKEFYARGDLAIASRAAVRAG